VLPDGECMNRWWCQWVIERKFKQWIKDSFGVQKRDVFLVEDHEWCLWTAEPLHAMDSIGVSLLRNYPKCSQDMNPIETAWRELRKRLAKTQPIERESRGAFIVRLRAAVAWVNRNRHAYLKRLCTCQAQWAADLLAQKGARTSH
jgi:transposase